MRVENCAMAGIAVGIGFVLAGGGNLPFVLGSQPAIMGLLHAIAAAFLITGAGNTINDYYDRKADRKNAPHRPIPSGMITARGAFQSAIAMFAIGIGVSYFINYQCLVLASLNSALLFLYGRNLKSSVFLGNVAVSYLTASTFVFGALIVGNPATTVFLALLAFLANVGREIIGDVEDIEGDKKSGIKTFATKHGAKKSWLYGRAYILFAVVLSPIPYVMGLLGASYLAVVAAADALFLLSIKGDNARRNQKLTKIAIFAGLVAFLFGALV